MKINAPKNSNYAAIVVTLHDSMFEPLENCDNLKYAKIFGYRVIVSKDTVANTKGIYFPVECQLSHEFIYNNNMYRDMTRNIDPKKSGFFEETRRVRCIRLRKNPSEGLFMPIECLNYISENIGDELNNGDVFDELNGKEICRKYVVVRKNMSGAPGSKKNGVKSGKNEDKLIDDQFRFHQDTKRLQNEIHRIYPESFINCSYKIHGTSFISARVLIKKHLNPILRIMKRLGIPIIDTEYGNLYSSRKVIKNRYRDTRKNNNNHYYKSDIWEEANKIIYPLIKNGMTVYGEIAGYTTEGSSIQKGYDYGCLDLCNGKQFHLYIYRITVTDSSGFVHEYTPQMIDNWLNIQIDTFPELARVVEIVPQLFNGQADEITPMVIGMTIDEWRTKFIEDCRTMFSIEDNCYICKNAVPREGIVIRKLDRFGFDALKFKAFKFMEHETKMLDAGEEDIEESN